MRLGKTLTRGVAVVAASALPLWMSAQPASAFETHGRTDIVEHTFSDFVPEDITCQIEFSASLVRDGSSGPFRAEATTKVDEGGPLDADACRAQVDVEVVYKDQAGVEHTVRAFGTQFADLQIEGVPGNFVAKHRANFLTCSANCERTFTTSPK